MSFHTLSAWPWFIYLALLFVTVFWKLARNRVFVSRLRPSATAPSLFAVAATLLVAIVYVVLVIRNPGVLPEVPKSLLTLLVVANAIYLANKRRTISAARSRNL